MNKHFSAAVLALAFAAVSFTGCGPKDADVEKSLTEAASGSQYLAGKSFTVKDGVATITGECPDEACRSGAEAEAKKVKGVKTVVNNITVMQAMTPAPAPSAPVESASDAALTNGLKDATKDFPGVTFSVMNGVVTLNGTLNRKDLPTIMQRVNAMKPMKVENQIKLK